MTSEDTPNVTSSPASASGPMPCAALGGLTTEPSGPEVARALLFRLQGKNNDALGVIARVICATLAEPDISSASIAVVIATPTVDTFGLSFPGSFASEILQSSLANRLRVSTDEIGSTLYRLIWKTHPMALRAPICALRASARRTSDSDSGLLRNGWPTASSRDWKDTAGMATEAVNPDGSTRNRTDQLPRKAQLAGWPTPNATEPNQTPEIVIARKKRLTETTGIHRGPALPLGSSVHLAGWPTPNATDGFWHDADWLFCRDGKWRPVEPGTFPLVNGAPARVGRLCAYGNAIVAPLAEEMIAAFMEVRP